VTATQNLSHQTIAPPPRRVLEERKAPVASPDSRTGIAGLLAIDRSVVASLDSQALVEVIVDHPADRPEAAAYDFSENQLPEFPGLAGFRVFTREVAILEM
jgi:hypothetical protein